MDTRYRNVGSVSVRLIEELSEMIQIICKADRFGWLNYHPNDEKQTPNIELLKKEYEDVKRIWEELMKFFK